MSFFLYTIGTLVLLAGVLYVCHAAHIPERWTVGIALLLLGSGIVNAAGNTRLRASRSL